MTDSQANGKDPGMDNPKEPGPRKEIRHNPAWAPPPGWRGDLHHSRPEARGQPTSRKGWARCPPPAGSTGGRVTGPRGGAGQVPTLA